MPLPFAYCGAGEALSTRRCLAWVRATVSALLLALLLASEASNAAEPVCLPLDRTDDASILPVTPTKTLLFEGSALGGDTLDIVASAYVFTVDDVAVQRLDTDAATATADYDSGRCDAVLLAAQVPRRMAGRVQLPVAAYGIEIVYSFAGGSSMAIFDGLPLFAAVWAGEITRWDDPAFAAGSGAPASMLPPGEVFVAVERFPNGSLEAEAASLGATFAQALSSASPAFADAYAAYGGDLAALVLGTVGLNRTFIIDPVVWSAVVPAGTTPTEPVYDPATGARLFASATSALASGDGVIAYTVAGDPATAPYVRPMLTNRAGRFFFAWAPSAAHAALDTYDALALRGIPYDTGVSGLSDLDDPNTWPVVGLVTALLRTDALPRGYDCQYAEAALDFLAWLEINDGALAATLASRGLVPLSSNFRQRATDMMGAVSLCPLFSASTTAARAHTSSSSSTAFGGETTPAAAQMSAMMSTTPTAIDAAATGTARVAAAALVGAGTTSLVWSGWMQAYASRVGAASATRLKLAEDGEDEAISRLALYGVDFAVTSAGAADLTPVLAAACVDCVSVPMAVRPFAPVYNVPEIARAEVPLLLDAGLLAGIMLGRIDTWNHTELAAANPSITHLLPDRPIIVVLAKGGSASGAGGPLGGVANRFAAEYMAADAAFCDAVLNGSTTTVGAASIVYPIESTAPARVIVAGDRVAATVKATPYSLGVDAVEAALAARNPSLADLRDAQGNRVSPTADALALATADFVLADFVARVPPRRAAAYAPLSTPASSSTRASPSHARRTNATLAFDGLPTMMVGGATARGWPILGWHHAYMHGETTPDCAKAAGLVDAFYWTQTSNDGAAVAAAQGLATSARVVGPGAAVRIVSALADVTCLSSAGTPVQVLGVAGCLYVPPDAADPATAVTVCANHGQCVADASASPTTTTWSAAACACDAGWTGAHCETIDAGSAGPGSRDDGVATSLIVGVAVGVAVPVCCGVVLLALLVGVLAFVRHRTAQRRALDSGCEIDPEEIKILRNLGAGATSDVFEGTWRGTRVAVKRFHAPARGWDRTALAHFSEEVRVMCALRHPHVVMFMGASTRPPVLAIVMEHMALGSLRDVLDNELLVQIPFKLKVAIAHHTAKGMHFLHSSGISHGDLKSLNILITEKWQAKVSDFGLSSMRSGSSGNGANNTGGGGKGGPDTPQHQQQQHNLGTVHWAAPERIRWASGGDEADVQAADVYSFGVVLWELLTRDSPYRGCSPAAVQVAVMRDGMRPDAHVARAALAAEGVDVFDAARYDPEDDISTAAENEAMPRPIVAAYVGLYRSCWDTDPSARPTLLGVLSELGEIAGHVHDARPYGASDSSSSSATHYCVPGTAGSTNRDADGSRTADTLTGASGGSQATDDGGGPGIDNGLVGAAGRRKGGRAPDGLVVIALADVAHAATLWETAPEAMATATLTLVQTLRRLTARYCGHESAQAGRSTASLFCAVFVDPCAAVAWAAASQRLLASDETAWPADLLACPEAAAEYPSTASTADIESGRARPVYRGLRVRMTLHHGHVRRVSCDPGRRPEYDGEGLKEALRLTPRVRGGHVLVTEALCRHLLERPRPAVERCLEAAGRIERAAGGAFGDSRARRQARFAAGAADIISGITATVDDRLVAEGGGRALSASPLIVARDTDAPGDVVGQAGALAWRNLDLMLKACDKAKRRHNEPGGLHRSGHLSNKSDGRTDALDARASDDDEDDDGHTSDDDGSQFSDGDPGSDQERENGSRVRALLCQVHVAQLEGRWTDHALLGTDIERHHGNDHSDDSDDSDDDDDDQDGGRRGGRAWGDGRRAELKFVDSANLCRAVIDPRTLKMGRVIGSGSFAAVHRANWYGAEVAVKRLARSRLTERDLCQFRAEVILHAKLDHVNVLPLFGACLQEGNLCLVTEYMPRGTLRDLLASPEGGRLGWDVRLRMLRHAARGVAYLHARSPPIVHRDLKPANLLVADQGDRIVVADFGLARVKEEGATMTACRGTRAYAAPEMLLSRPCTEKVDVYAMGMIMWSVLTRREPFADRGAHDAEVYADIIGGTRPQVPADAPEDFKVLMARCWNNNPTRRPTMQVVVDALTDMIGDAHGMDVEMGLA
ncbi:Serine/threonine protein kinase [Pandoravirus salinus]|uniref:Serine/threonine protein kinase n=1 Tax=Pandoravirus salinus TaxID=1349410 RepID=A0A291ATY9_9VIRU|nr:serine-threonine kinase [Pandoravirus salinus]ATE82248.1 Serine/threonine protein kinase [Pandoravirus salinus]